MKINKFLVMSVAISGVLAMLSVCYYYVVFLPSEYKKRGQEQTLCIKKTADFADEFRKNYCLKRDEEVNCELTENEKDEIGKWENEAIKYCTLVIN